MEQPTEQTVRTGNRERQRLHRRREAQKRARSIEAQHLASESAEREGRDLHFFGESSPGCDAQTCAEELQIHREFLRALGRPEVQPGETLRTIARRTYEGWVKGPFACGIRGSPTYVPAFSRTSQQFDPDFGFGVGDAPFEQIWTPPKNCTGDQLIDVASLPELPRLKRNKKTEESKPEPQPIPTPAPPPPIQQQPELVNFAWIPVDAQRYLQGGRI